MDERREFVLLILLVCRGGFVFHAPWRTVVWWRQPWPTSTVGVVVEEGVGDDAFFQADVWLLIVFKCVWRPYCFCLLTGVFPWRWKTAGSQGKPDRLSAGEDNTFVSELIFEAALFVM